jgi:hypothetical protein
VVAGDGSRGGKREARGGRGRGGAEEEAAVERVQGAPGGGEGGRHGMGESRSGSGVNQRMRTLGHRHVGPAPRVSGPKLSQGILVLNQPLLKSVEDLRLRSVSIRFV